MNSENSKKYKSKLQGTDDLISPVDQKKVIVIDIGSNYIRIGLSGDNMPMLNLPLVLGKSKHRDSNDLTRTKIPDTYGIKSRKIFKDKHEDYYLVYPLIDLTDMKQ